MKADLILQMADAAAVKEPIKSVQTYGRKKTATAVAYCKRGKGILNVNGKPLEQVGETLIVIMISRDLGMPD